MSKLHVQEKNIFFVYSQATSSSDSAVVNIASRSSSDRAVDSSSSPNAVDSSPSPSAVDSSPSTSAVALEELEVLHLYQYTFFFLNLGPLFNRRKKEGTALSPQKAWATKSDESQTISRAKQAVCRQRVFGIN